MVYPWLTPLIGALACFLLATVVSRRGPNNALSQSFVFLAVMLVFWNLNFFILYSVSDYALAFDLTRVLRIGSFFLMPAILNLFVAVRQSRSSGWRVVLIADYAVACFLVVVNVRDRIVIGLHSFAWGYYSIGSTYYNVFTLLYLFNISIVLGLLIYDYRSSHDPRLRVQLRFWWLGAIIALPLGLTQLLPAYGIAIYPLGNIASAVWAGIVAYAIVRHRLMDTDVVITKGMAYAIVSLILVAPAFLLILWLERLSFAQIHPDFSFAVLLTLIAVGVLFPTLRLRAESRIERSLFGDKHHYRVALHDFTRSIVRILDRERLVRELATTVGKLMNLDRVAIGLGDETGRKFTIACALGVPPVASDFSSEDAFICCLKRRQDCVLRDELEAPEDQDAAEVFRSSGWEVCIPLSVTANLIGFIALGRKRDRDPFFVEDLQLMATLAAEASVALENARLYEELRRSRDIIRKADRLSALGTLAAGIAHEIRNPLVSIQTFFQLAPDRLNDHEFLTEFLKLTSGEVKRITDLISDLLSFAKSPKPYTSAVNIGEVLDGVVKLIEPRLKHGRVVLMRDSLSHLSPVRADQDQLKQVFLNILLNAVESVVDEPGEIAIRGVEVVHQDERFCRVSVTDSGTGIPGDLLDHIFDPFFSTKEAGTGLGLAIAHQIVAEHGGFIVVSSQVGEGTTFSVHLRPAEGGGEAEGNVDEPLRAIGGRYGDW